ncbi:PDR/VanB family oxidoreductase [Pararobbsia silviterrae]|uniref:Oxidoreductase n=1 Tax=Pararobbsia silviterrae TaxID=1792498 RepID=A0A494XRT7_9BURK|nr:PDR/VanB family oxidoreductase [Pararobbsia silviterrae]RKP53315.1 oxidoreductase [Pararobbsia silviterrae]
MGTIEVTVSEIGAAGARDARIRLVAADGAPLPAFDAGAHIDVVLPHGLMRQYSLVNGPSDRDAYEICVRRAADSRGASTWIHDTLRVGQALGISAPRCAFALDEAARYVLIAGGIGVTPLISMARALSAQGKPFDFHFYGRSEDDVPYLDVLREGFASGRVFIHLGAQGQRLRDALPDALAVPDADALVYVCGPGGFMDHLKAQSIAAGWQPSQIRSEAFAASAHTGPTDADGTFEVELKSSGKIFIVPADRTIAAVLGDAQIEMSLSCEQGICGSCLTGVVSGRVDHRDEVQSVEEKDAHSHIAICCSRALSPRIVLDL